MISQWGIKKTLSFLLFFPKKGVYLVNKIWVSNMQLFNVSLILLLLKSQSFIHWFWMLYLWIYKKTILWNVMHFLLDFISLQVVEELGQFEQAVHPLPLKDREELTQIQAFPASAALTDEESPVSEGLHPIIVWWSPLTGELGRLGECGNNKCYFTVNKSYHSHPATQAFLFYGK